MCQYLFVSASMCHGVSACDIISPTCCPKTVKFVIGNTLATNIVIKRANGQQIKEKILTKSVANEGID